MGLASSRRQPLQFTLPGPPTRAFREICPTKVSPFNADAQTTAPSPATAAQILSTSGRSTFSVLRPSDARGPQSALQRYGQPPFGTHEWSTDQPRYDGAVFTVSVGSTKKEWHIHENILTKDSDFFAAAAKKQWSEGQDKRITLSDDDPETFQVYVGWLYERKILIQVLPAPPAFAAPTPTFSFARESDHFFPDGTANEISTLIDCYLLGEKFQDSVFRNAVINTLIACIHPMGTDTWHVPHLSRCVARAYDGTCEGSPLRKLLVDTFVYHSNTAESVTEAFEKPDFPKRLPWSFSRSDSCRRVRLLSRWEPRDQLVGTISPTRASDCRSRGGKGWMGEKRDPMSDRVRRACLRPPKV